jgi:hypothetical protein
VPIDEIEERVEGTASISMLNPMVKSGLKEVATNFSLELRFLTKVQRA